MSAPVSEASLIGLSSSLMGLSIVVVALRFAARKVQHVPYKLDDWLIIAALVCLIGSVITYLIGATKYELGAPTDYNLPGAEEGLSNQIVYGYKAEFITLMLQPWLLGFVKISIVFFYRRIFCTGGRTVFSVITIVFMALTLAWTLAFFFAVLFSCGSDVKAIWGSFEEFSEHCDNTVLLDEIYAIIDFVLDLAVFIMPLPMIWRLHMKTARRIGVSLVLTIGALTVVSSCIRMAIMISIAKGNGQNTNLLGTDDPSLQTATFLYWTMLEQGLAVIVACLPTLRALLRIQAIESIVRSVRSMASLDSVRSGDSRRYRGHERGESSASQTAIAKHTDFDVDIEHQDHPDSSIKMASTSRGSGE